MPHAGRLAGKQGVQAWQQALWQSRGRACSAGLLSQRVALAQKRQKSSGMGLRVKTLCSLSSSSSASSSSSSSDEDPSAGAPGPLKPLGRSLPCPPAPRPQQQPQATTGGYFRNQQQLKKLAQAFRCVARQQGRAAGLRRGGGRQVDQAKLPDCLLAGAGRACLGRRRLPLEQRHRSSRL